MSLAGTAEHAVVALLEADSTVAGLVGERIWPNRIEQFEAMPAITYLRVSTPRTKSHGGPSGLASPRIQVNCWGSDATTARQVAEAVRRKVDGWSGVAGGVRVDGIFVDGDRDDLDTERGIQRIILDLRVWHGETV